MRESASNKRNHQNGRPRATMVAKVDCHGKLIALASDQPVQVMLISDEPGPCPFGVEVIDGPNSMIPAEILEIAQNMHKTGRSIVFEDGPICWRYNDIRKWWEACHGGRTILHVELPEGQLPNDQTRALAKNMAEDEVIN